jgi:hypothetical protein
MKRFLRYFLEAVLFGAGCALALLFLEVFLRNAEIILPSALTSDPRIGTVFRPARDMILFKEGFYIGRSNHYGYLGPDYPPERTPHSIRIALIGDSYVEGFQLFDRYHFRNILEQELRSFTGMDVEVLNFGRSGFDLPDMYAYYKTFVSRFHPDLALVFVHVSDLNATQHLLGPRCTLENDSVRLSFKFNASDEYLYRERTAWIRGRIALIGLALNCATTLEEGEAGRIILDKFYRAGSQASEWPAAAPLGEADPLGKLDRAIFQGFTRDGDRPPGEQVAIVNMGMPETAIDAITTIGLEVYDPNPALKELEARGINPHYWKATGKLGHWNHEANRSVGLYLAHEVENTLHLQPARGR